MQKRYHVMVLLQGMFPNTDTCEQFFEEENWYFRENDTQGKKVVPLFPYLQKMVIHQHQYFGTVLSDDAAAGTDKKYFSQVVLEVSGYSKDDIESDLMEGDWLRPQSGLTMFPPVVFLKGYEDKVLSTVAWELRSGS